MKQMVDRYRGCSLLHARAAQFYCCRCIVFAIRVKTSSQTILLGRQRNGSSALAKRSVTTAPLCSEDVYNAVEVPDFLVF